MTPKREVIATANTAEELTEQLQAKATELNLTSPAQNDRNAWGPIFANADYDLRIDRQTASGQFALCLLHKLKPTGGLWGRLRKR